VDNLEFWIGITSGILTIIGFIAQFWERMKALKDRLGGRKFILGLLICSFTLSAISIYLSSGYRAKSIKVTISAYVPAYPAPMQVVKDQTFENTDVPLDGYDHDHDTFRNVCFLYMGGSYELQDVTLKEHWQICTRKDELKNYLDLMDAFRLLDPNRRQSSHNTVGR
jgi:hypothetical protein